eukprot:6232983-Prymnesium_polylepis.1
MPCAQLRVARAPAAAAAAALCLVLASHCREAALNVVLINLKLAQHASHRLVRYLLEQATVCQVAGSRDPIVEGLLRRIVIDGIRCLGLNLGLSLSLGLGLGLDLGLSLL